VLLTGFLAGPSAAAPVGLALGLPGWATVLALSLGAGVSFVIALFAMEFVRRVRGHHPLRFLRNTYTFRLVRRLRLRRHHGTDPAERAERDAARRAARMDKARRLLTRFGPAGFGLVGPALFGTWVSAVLGSALGLARQRLLVWLVVGATTWSALLVIASHTMLGWLFT
jgi:hypothetical protein